MNTDIQYILREICPGCLGQLRKHENDDVYQMSCGAETQRKFYNRCLFCHRCVLEIKKYKLEECPCCLRSSQCTNLKEKFQEQKRGAKLFVCDKNEIVFLRGRHLPDFELQPECEYTQSFKFGEQVSTISKIYSVGNRLDSGSISYIECMLCEKCDIELCQVIVCRTNKLFCYKCALEEIQLTPSEFRLVGNPAARTKGLEYIKDLEENFQEAERIFENRFVELAREEETEISKIRKKYEQQKRDIERKEHAELARKRQEYAAKAFPLKKKLAEYKFNSNVAVYFRKTMRALEELSTEFSNNLPLQQLAPKVVNFFERCGLLAADFKNPQEFFENLTDAEEDNDKEDFGNNDEIILDVDDKECGIHDAKSELNILKKSSGASPVAGNEKMTKQSVLERMKKFFGHHFQATYESEFDDVHAFLTKDCHLNPDVFYRLSIDKLTVSGFGISIPSKIPENLKYLDIQDYDGKLPDLPRSLVYLSMKEFSGKHGAIHDLPHTLQELYLPRYDSVSKLCLPRSLKKLVLRDFTGPIGPLPCGLEHLVLEKFTRYISTLPNTIKNLKLGLYNSYLPELPKYLTKLVLDEHTEKIFYLPDTLEHMHLGKYDLPLPSLPKSLREIRVPNYSKPLKIQPSVHTNLVYFETKLGATTVNKI